MIPPEVWKALAVAGAAAAAVLIIHIIDWLKEDGYL
jgi:hypothetical protein